TLLSAQQKSEPVHAVAYPPGKFVDITPSSGINFQYQASHTTKKYLLETMGPGVALFDYDNDGRLDIFVVNGAPLSDPMAKGAIPQKTGPKYWNRLYHQKFDGTFEDVTEKAGLQGAGYGMGVAVGDYDDDVWCGEHREGYRAYCHPDYFKPIAPLVYHNDGNGHFTEISQKIGLAKAGKGLGVALADYDRDGKVDLFVANDSMLEFLFHNK